MGWWIGLWALAAMISLALLITLFRAGKPVRRLIGSGVQGLCAVAAVNLTGAFTGVSLGLNVLSGACCALFGVPGVVTLLLLKTVFGV